MRYAVWNNKGGVGKSFLSFVLGTELAHKGDSPVLLVDMCPQANLSEIVLGGNGTGAERLAELIRQRKTVGGYFDTRITSPHAVTGSESDFLIRAKVYNPDLPGNVYLLAGDPSLELQAQVINQIGGQSLPVEAWKNVHNWLCDLVGECSNHLGVGQTKTIIDCNPSFSAYTELSMLAADRLIVPCSSDGSSARAIDNLGSLVYGENSGSNYGSAVFPARAKAFQMPLPQVHSVLLNRSTLYSNKASKAFQAMFDEIQRRVQSLRAKRPDCFVAGEPKFHVVPDSHSVAIVCSHAGRPLYSLQPGQYAVHETTPQVNPEPLERYKGAVAAVVATL